MHIQSFFVQRFTSRAELPQFTIKTESHDFDTKVSEQSQSSPDSWWNQHMHLITKVYQRSVYNKNGLSRLGDLHLWVEPSYSEWMGFCGFERKFYKQSGVAEYILIRNQN